MENTAKEADEDPKELGLREIGNNAVWTVSTCKPGFGVEQLRDDSFDTYWQSDGPQPHAVTIQFLKRQIVSELHLYVDYAQDESYAPKKIIVRAGSFYHDLKDIKSTDLNEPQGWIRIKLGGDGDYPDTATDHIPFVPPFTSPECTMYTCLR